MIFLTILYHTAVLGSIATAYKMVQIGDFITNGGLFIYPLTFTVADVVAEVYGYTYAKNMIWSSIICDYVFAFAVSYIVQLPSPPDWHNSEAYKVVLGHSVRFVFAGTCSILISGFVNVYLISKWKVLLKGRYFWLRSIASTAIGEIALNSIGLLIGFSGIESLSRILELGASMYICMLFYTLITATPLALIVMMLKYHEGVDAYDHDISYNPFK